MAHYQITLDSATLHQLFLEGAGESGMKTLLETVLNQVLQAQATEQFATQPSVAINFTIRHCKRESTR